MNTKSSVLKQVLFVDNSPKFLQKLRAKMPTWSRDNWELLFASDASKAFTMLETQQVDMVVIDLGVSDIESAQFLKLVHQKHPHIRKAILSSSPDQNTRRDCLQSGADMYLIKPKRTNGFEAIFHSLNQLFTLSQEGFRGLLRTISLTDLIQLECLNARSSVLEISAGKQFGRVFIKRGAIIHAQAGSKTGVNAFIRLMHMAGGDFNLKPFTDPGIQTIEIPCDSLLLEASHAVDTGREQTSHESSQDNNTTWFRGDSMRTNRPSTKQTPASDSATESINFLQIAEPAADPTDFFPKHTRHPQPSNIASASLQTIINLTDELIGDRSHLDMKILDLAVLKEELNMCKSRLVEVISQMRQYAADTQPRTDGLAGLTCYLSSLDEISNDTSTVVRQLDGCFSTFTEESSNFNETSTKLQSEITRLQEASVFQSTE